MKILLVAATKLEMNLIVKQLKGNDCSLNLTKNIIYKELNIDILITGIGLVFTCYHLLKTLFSSSYDLIINLGIAGSYNRNIQIGEVVNVVQEEFSDLGIENPTEFKTIFESGFVDKNNFPFIDGKLKSDVYNNLLIKQLRQVKSISSNTAHGKEITINSLIEKFKPDIESMEGAAFFYVCTMEKLDFIQIRAISNYVEPKNVKNWNIDLALENLSNLMIGLFDDLTNKK